MKRIIEDNYLGFRLEIEVDSLNKIVVGSLFDIVRYPWGDEEYEEVYSAVATCQDVDKFTELKGIKLVKLKLAKQYHADMKYLYGDVVRELKKALRESEEILNYHLKKLDNIEHTMKKDYDMTFKKKEVKKPVKNSKTTKTGKKKTI